MTQARDRCIVWQGARCARATGSNALLNSTTNQVRLSNEVQQDWAQIEQLTMTRTARKAANSASPDQLSFLFGDAPPTRVLEEVVIASPASRTAVVKAARPAPAPAPPPKRYAKRTLQVVRSEDRSLTVEETAELMSVSVKTLEAWRRLGKGPEFVKLGRSVRYTMRALDAFTRARTVRNSAEGRMLDAQR